MYGTHTHFFVIQFQDHNILITCSFGHLIGIDVFSNHEALGKGTACTLLWKQVPLSMKA